MFPIIVGQDGEIINSEANKFSLNVSDKSIDNNRFNFVGFIIENEKILTVFPKHFYSEKNLNLNQKVLEEDIELLFKVIFKYVMNLKKEYDDYNYIGNKDNFESNYPFYYFFEIYDYFKKYGIYQEEKKIIKENCNGKISWKKTIQNSNIVVSNHNMIFMPLYYNKIDYIQNFISECMIYVINYTINNFPFFFKLKPILNRKIKFDFLANKEFTLRNLYKIKNNAFKDTKRKLITNLIGFFENYNKHSVGGKIVIKLRDFSPVWEKMVNNYLNCYFNSIDENSYRINFTNKKYKGKERFNKKCFIIDQYNKFNIQPDHYFETENEIYLFDSKYYEKVENLDYKQLAYTFLIGNCNKEKIRNKKIYSALILPGKIERYKFHMKLSDDYCQMKKGCNQIGEQYLNVKKLMKEYI